MKQVESFTKENITKPFVQLKKVRNANSYIGIIFLREKSKTHLCPRKY